MPKCRFCGLSVVRVHRRAVEKILYAEAFRCRGCGRRSHRLHRKLAIPLWFFSPHTRCGCCGTADVRRLSKRDRVESVSRSFVSRIQQLTGAPLNWCAACRLQFYDWRPLPRLQPSRDHLHAPAAELKTSKG